jgi:nicotinate-nucleotide adenylyltransferase
MNDSASSPVGILGGTFDPVHYGHLRAAVEVRELLGLGEVRLLPAASPPHRAAPAASAEHRLAMLERATACQEFLTADDCEMRRSGPSYMVDTLTELHGRIPDNPLVLMIGQDAANGLDRWHRWKRLFELAHIAVMRRPGTNPDYRGELQEEMRKRRVNDPAALSLSPAGSVIAVEITQLEISASAIRDKVEAGRSLHYLTPLPVIEYIRQHGLYAC